MLPLETKQSGGKLLPHSDLRGGVPLEEVSCHRLKNFNNSNNNNNKPNMNSIIKTAAKITEELIQPNEKSDSKQDGIQRAKAR